MRRIPLIAIFLASLTAMACVKTTYVPTAPGGGNGSSGNTTDWRRLRQFGEQRSSHGRSLQRCLGLIHDRRPALRDLF